MFRIVHIDTSKELRGGQWQLLLLARGLRTRGHTQLLVCPEDSPLEARAGQEGFRVLTLPAHDPGHGHGIVQLRQQLLAEPCEILHAHDGRGQTLAWLASLGMPLCRVASRRVTYLQVGLLSRLASTRLKYALTCHGIIAVSEFVRQLVIGCGVPKAKVELIPDGVELPSHLPNSDLRSRIRAQWGFGEQEFVVGHVGAFSHEKGQDIAIEAAGHLEKTVPQGRLLLVGRGPTLARRGDTSLEQELHRLRDRVRMLGYLENLTEFFAGLDLYIMPSRVEGLGSSALLAMAHGLPVVASRVGGLPEVVEEGKTGWLIPPGSPTALADAITLAASDRARLRELGLNARQRARQFTDAIMVVRTEAFYCRLLGRGAQ